MSTRPESSVGLENKTDQVGVLLDFIETTIERARQMTVWGTLLGPHQDLTTDEFRFPPIGNPYHTQTNQEGFWTDIAMCGGFINRYLMASGGLPVRYIDEVSGEQTEAVLTYCKSYDATSDKWEMVAGIPGQIPHPTQPLLHLSIQSHELREYYAATQTP